MPPSLTVPKRFRFSLEKKNFYFRLNIKKKKIEICISYPSSIKTKLIKKKNKTTKKRKGFFVWEKGGERTTIKKRKKNDNKEAILFFFFFFFLPKIHVLVNEFDLSKILILGKTNFSPGSGRIDARVASRSPVDDRIAAIDYCAFGYAESSQPIEIVPRARVERFFGEGTNPRSKVIRH